MTVLRELGHDLIPIETARDLILSSVSPLDEEARPLPLAAGAVLREDVACGEDVPPFDNSAMDGYAVRAADIAAAAGEAPVTLRVQGGLPAGEGAPALEPGAAIRIMTGAPIPPGADAVVPHEMTVFDAAAVSFHAAARPGQNIRRAGGDLRAGAVALTAGAVLRGPQLAILASLGRATVRVTRPLRVAVISPGNELVPPGLPRGPGQIWNANAHAISASLCDLGAEPIDLGIIPDSKEAVLAAVGKALAAGADAVVSTGGVSAGDFDFVQAAVRDAARPGHVLKVAMRPGKPQVFGLFDGKPLFGLPGNPASAIISFEVFVRPALRKMRGEAEFLDPPFGVRFAFVHRYKPGRVFLLRARVEPDDVPSPDGPPRAWTRASGFRVAAAGAQDSSFLSSLARANAIIRLPANRDRVEEGEVHPATWIGGRP
jgi:molybdopterin molybdotransferase